MQSSIFGLFERIKDRPTGLIVACNDYFELAGRGIKSHDIISPSDYEEHGIQHHFLPIADFTANVDDKLVVDTLSLMKQFNQQQKPIVVHCKAGRSRSAMIVVLHLIQIDASLHVIDDSGQLNSKATLSNAIDKLMAIRTNVVIEQSKRLKAQKIIEACFVSDDKSKQQSSYTNIARSFSTQLPTRLTVEAYLCSEQFIKDFLQSHEYKKLMMYIANDYSKNIIFFKMIKSFFESIMQGDLAWYSNLHQLEDATLNDALIGFCSQQQWEKEILRGSKEQNRCCYHLINNLKKRVDALLNYRFPQYTQTFSVRRTTVSQQKKSLIQQELLDRDAANPTLNTFFGLSLFSGAAVLTGVFFFPAMPLIIPVVVGIMGVFIMTYSLMGLFAINAFPTRGCGMNNYSAQDHSLAQTVPLLTATAGAWLCTIIEHLLQHNNLGYL